MSTQKNELYHILSPEWLKTNPLPEDGEFENNDGKWLASSRRGHVTPGWNEYPYRTRRTDLPPEAYATPPTDTTGSGREGETPETDRATKYQVRVYPHQNGTIETVRVELAKQLERQRDAARKALQSIAMLPLNSEPRAMFDRAQEIATKALLAAIDSAQRQEGR